MDDFLKTEITDKECECLAEKLHYYLDVKYKNEFSGVPEHIKHTLCQNYILQLKNNNLNFEELLDNLGI